MRIVAATNVNMMKAIEDGRFREDLYYRLNTVQIDMPPLRERKGDIHLFSENSPLILPKKIQNARVAIDR